MPTQRSVGAVVSTFCVGLAAIAWGLGPGASSTRTVHAGHANLVNVLSPDYVQAQYEKGRKLTPVDLRSADEFQQGHLPGAHSLPLGQLAARFQEIPKVDLVVLYCDCPQADIEAAYWFLRRQQYRNLSVLEQGFTAWMQRGFPIAR